MPAGYAHSRTGWQGGWFIQKNNDGYTGSMQGINQTVVYLGDSPPEDELVGCLQSAGVELRYLDTTRQLSQTLHKTRAFALIVDLTSDKTEQACLDAVQAALAKVEIVPHVVYLSERADQDLRLRAVQAGGNVFLSRPVSPQVMMQHLEPVLLQGQAGCRVLLIGGTPDLLSGATPVLEQAGMTVRQVKSPSQALLSVINFSPDALIIEESLAGCRGEDLADMIHQVADYADLPVLFLYSQGDRDTDRFNDHCCEWLGSRRLKPEKLLARIEQRVRVSRMRNYRIRYLQARDPVTGLLNRQEFLAILERGVYEGESAALVLLELENLQHHYPQLAPHLLDSLLVIVASQAGMLAEHAELAGRIGDYTLAYIIRGKTSGEITELGRQVSYTVTSHLYDAGEHSIAIGCSIGIAIPRQRLEGGLPLLSSALKACQESHSTGTGKSRVAVSMLDPVVVSGSRNQEEAALLALLRDTSSMTRFHLVYQPIASLRGNDVEKYEVLLRLHDTGNQPVPPARFVPLAERHGLMGSIDRWVVEQVITTMQRRAISTRFFVKLSADSLGDPGFATFLKKSLKKHGVSGERLVFELNAASINGNIRNAVRFCEELRRHDCGVSLEHCEIGQNVAQLFDHIPADYVKLGGHIIRNLADDPDRQERLRAFIKQAEKLDIQIIAGFVENADCLQVLWNSGVHYIQGNFLQEPDETLEFDFG